jgi:hypothetical protein
MTATPLLIEETVKPDLTLVVQSWPDRARAIVIETDDDATKAAELLNDVKKLRGEVDASFNPIITKAHEAHKEALAQKKRHSDPLDEAERVLKATLNVFRQQQERKALEERRRLEEAARKLEEEQRLAEVDAALAADDEVAAEEIIQRPMQVAAPKVAAFKPAGVTYREKWTFEVTSLTELVKHCAAHPEDINLLAPNTTAIRALVLARKKSFTVPGLRAWDEGNVAASRR